MHQNHPSRFTDELWAAATPIYDAILEHPFIGGLTEGNLTEDRFSYYVMQDALYLREFAKALTGLASTAPKPEVLEMFCRHATDAMAVERSLHEGFFQDLGLHPEQVDSTPPSPTTRAYCDFMIASVRSGSFEEGLAAVLPCYWIYQKVGQALLPAGSPNPLYQRWIETYGSDEFDQVVQDVLDLTNQVASDASKTLKSSMRTLFLLGCRYEWMFWDAAYTLQDWPV